MDILFVPLSAMEGQYEEHMNTLRFDIPSDSVVIESVPRLNLIPEIFYSKYQYVPSLLRLCSSGNRGLLFYNGTFQSATLLFSRP